MERRPICLRPLLALCVALAACSSLPIAAEEKPPNVLVIVADDLGYSDLGCFGGEIDTPHLDGLAARGVRLTQFHTTARCCPSRASLLTGRYPHAVGLGHMTQDIGRPGYRGRLDPDAKTIAEHLAPAGYRSFLAGKWHLGTPDPTRHGFEEFYGTLVSAKTFWDADHYLRLPEGREKVSSAEPFYGTDGITDHAISFLDTTRQTPDRPWFLYLAYNAPHFPLQAPKDLIDKYVPRYEQGWDAIRQSRLERMKSLGLFAGSVTLPPHSDWTNYGGTETGTNPDWDSLTADRQTDLTRRMAIYAAMVEQMDAGIGRVLGSIESAGETDETLVLFVSDNGACAEWSPTGFDGKSSNNNVLHTGAMLDEMGQPGTFHSAGSGWAEASNTPYRMFKHYCHQGGVITPCIIAGVSGEFGEAGSLERTPYHLIDVLPTIRDEAGLSADESLPSEGLMAVRDGNDRPILLEHEGNRGIRMGPWKAVAFRGEPWELYNLDDDPNELRNLAKARFDLVRVLVAEWSSLAHATDTTPLPTDYGVQYLPPLEENEAVIYDLPDSVERD